MDSNYYRVSPAQVFLATVILGLAMSAFAVWVAVSQPHIDLPTGSVPTRVGSVEVVPTDLIEEPDQLGSWSAIRDFYDRQSLLRAELDAPTVDVEYVLLDGTVQSQTFEVRSRMIGDLPWVFWFQNIVGLISLFFGGWVLGLRGKDWGARMFALTAVLFPMAAISASVYSTRQIALDGDLFWHLSSLNSTGAPGFGIALVCLFAMYPAPLVRPRWLLVPLIVFGIPLVMTIMKVGIDSQVSVVVVAEMLTALVLGAIQWIRSRREPLNRAGLRWFVLICLVGCSLFVGLVAAPVALGLSDEGLISQGYAFGFFNLMHFGLALGVLRYRLFNLDRWSYYIWLWLSGMVLIILLDIAVVNLLHAQPWMSLSLALLIAGFLYFPLRQFLMNFLLRRQKSSISGKLADIVNVALSPTERQHVERWDKLLQDVFEPLAPPEPVEEEVEAAQIDDDGLELVVPGGRGLQARRLRYAQQGRRLFTPDDIDVVANLVQMHDLATDSRESYERGVTLERDRISRDIHDNIGAQLLSALHSRESARKDDLLRDSLTDLRAIINDGFLASYPLEDVTADLRRETASRFEANNIVLNWTGPDLSAQHHPNEVQFDIANGMRSILREAVSNILRHAEASVVDIDVAFDVDGVKLVIMDDGKGLKEAGNGNGIPNIVERAAAASGQASVTEREGPQSGTVVRVRLPYVRDVLEERAS